MQESETAHLFEDEPSTVRQPGELHVELANHFLDGAKVSEEFKQKCLQKAWANRKLTDALIRAVTQRLSTRTRSFADDLGLHGTP